MPMQHSMANTKSYQDFENLTVEFQKWGEQVRWWRSDAQRWRQEDNRVTQVMYACIKYQIGQPVDGMYTESHVNVLMGWGSQ